MESVPAELVCFIGAARIGCRGRVRLESAGFSGGKGPGTASLEGRGRSSALSIQLQTAHWSSIDLKKKIF